ncbi:hypothetical protein YC2023_031720 [Brassica napus]
MVICEGLKVSDLELENGSLRYVCGTYGQNSRPSTSTCSLFILVRNSDCLSTTLLSISTHIYLHLVVVSFRFLPEHDGKCPSSNMCLNMSKRKKENENSIFSHIPPDGLSRCLYYGSHSIRTKKKSPLLTSCGWFSIVLDLLISNELEPFVPLGIPLREYLSQTIKSLGCFIPKDKNYGLLFNPEEKDKFYDTQDLVNDFGKSSCVATYKSWLLMITYTEEVYLYNPYIFDLLTRERINLLSFESDYGFISPVLWIDEKTKDYLVVRMFNEENAVSIRKGDNSWKPITQLQFPCIYECYNMVYKDHKLYCLDHYNLTIFYFSGHVPSQVFEISVDGCVNRTTVAGAIRHLGTIPCKHYLACYKNSMVVTVDGDVLILNSVRESMSYIWDFKIYKMGSLTGSKWEEIFVRKDD